ncbi:MAG TPA: arginase family protein [Streptosporangiaceae bacterium]|nr:arginase family protein [Streptosporangiaceae bacterium]
MAARRIGVPTSAGSHHAGQDRAPAALRAAGFVSRLAEAGLDVADLDVAGLDVADLGDLPGAVFTPDAAGATARSLATVVRVASAVTDAVAAALATGRLPVVLGGDCTITLGALAGLQRHDPGAALIYFDGDADLGTPQTTSSGVLDAMGIAHLLGLADNPLARLGPAFPMLTDDRLVLVGYDESDPETYQAGVLAARPGLTRFPDHQVRADPAGTAAGALAAVRAAGSLLVHFDVDAVDGRDLPLANFPHYGTGVPLSTAGDVLAAFLRAPALRAVVLTEVNPSYDPSGGTLGRYVAMVTRALAGTGELAGPPAS